MPVMARMTSSPQRNDGRDARPTCCAQNQRN
jgi:hypothetical protein